MRRIIDLTNIVDGFNAMLPQLAEDDCETTLQLKVHNKTVCNKDAVEVSLLDIFTGKESHLSKCLTRKTLVLTPINAIRIIGFLIKEAETELNTLSQENIAIITEASSSPVQPPHYVSQ